MNKGQFRDINGHLLTPEQTATSCNLGRSTVMRLAEESGSIIRIGRSVRIDIDKFLKYVRTVYGE